MNRETGIWFDPVFERVDEPVMGKLISVLQEFDGWKFPGKPH